MIPVDWHQLYEDEARECAEMEEDRNAWRATSEKAELQLARVQLIMDNHWDLPPGGTYSENVDQRIVWLADLEDALHGTGMFSEIVDDNV